MISSSHNPHSHWHCRLCPCQAVLQTSANPGLAHQCAWGHLGSAGLWGNCSLLTKHQPVPSPREDEASVCLVPLSPQKHLWLREGVTLGRSFSGPRNNHLQKRVSSSFTSPSWTRDFFNQVMLKHYHHTIILSALVKIRWGKGQLTSHCPSHVISRSSYHGIWTGMPRADHLSCKRKKKKVHKLHCENHCV